MVGDHEPRPSQGAESRVEHAPGQRLWRPPAESQQAREVHLAAAGDIEDARCRVIDRVLDDGDRVAFVRELEAWIEPHQGRYDGEGQVAADRVPHTRAEDGGETQGRERDVRHAQRQLIDESLHLRQVALIAAASTPWASLFRHDRRVARIGPVDGRVGLHDDGSNGPDPFDGTEQRQGSHDAVLALGGASLLGPSIDGLEMDHDVGFDLQHVSCEREAIEVHLHELGSEVDPRRSVVDGEHVDVVALVEPCDQLATRPARRARDEHPLHPIESRSGAVPKLMPDRTHGPVGVVHHAEDQVRTAAVIGIGLIGGSIATGLRRAGWRVVGHDANSDHAQRALELDLLDHVEPTLAGAVAGADLVVVATPPTATIEVLSAISTESVVFDVAGVKSPVVPAGRHLPGFVATHPMAGRETSGPDAASPALFNGATWVIVEGAAPEPTGAVVAVVEALGGRPVFMSAEAHDRAVALISHLPQVVASGLLGIAAEDTAALDLAAGSFRDLTRVGASEPLGWVEILKSNEPAVLEAIAALRSRLDMLEAAIGTPDDTLLALLARARDTRRALGSPVAQVRVALADEPGQLARVGHAFEASGVDIRDIQMRHAPYGGGGVLTLSVRPGEEGALRHALEDEGLLIVG